MQKKHSTASDRGHWQAAEYVPIYGGELTGSPQSIGTGPNAGARDHGGALSDDDLYAPGSPPQATGKGKQRADDDDLPADSHSKGRVPHSDPPVPAGSRPHPSTTGHPDGARSEGVSHTAATPVDIKGKGKAVDNSQGQAPHSGSPQSFPDVTLLLPDPAPSLKRRPSFQPDGPGILPATPAAQAPLGLSRKPSKVWQSTGASSEFQTGGAGGSAASKPLEKYKPKDSKDTKDKKDQKGKKKDDNGNSGGRR